MQGAAPPPYARYAFRNLYNYVFLASMGLLTLLGQDPTWILAGAALEAVWMTLAPGSRIVRALLLDSMHREATAAAEESRREALVESLPQDERRRYWRLRARRREIEEHAGENASISRVLLDSELRKTDRILRAFLDLAVLVRRLEQHLAAVDRFKLDNDVRRYVNALDGKNVSGPLPIPTTQPDITRPKGKRIRGRPALDHALNPLPLDPPPPPAPPPSIPSPLNPQARVTIEQNLAILRKRLARLDEAQAFIAQARGQLDLIENTFELLVDEVVTMRSPKDLGTQLDTVIEGVEEARGAARETEALFGDVA